RPMNTRPSALNTATPTQSRYGMVSRFGMLFLHQEAGRDDVYALVGKVASPFGNGFDRHRQGRNDADGGAVLSRARFQRRKFGEDRAARRIAVERRVDPTERNAVGLRQLRRQRAVGAAVVEIA